ncbi:MAG TPA: hypothetical protein VMU06_09550 [Stellaceae bacterium]|nr:hypothetical protein [Stellaceae bacterium]
MIARTFTLAAAMAVLLTTLIAPTQIAVADAPGEGAIGPFRERGPGGIVWCKWLVRKWGGGYSTFYTDCDD